MGTVHRVSLDRVKERKPHIMYEHEEVRDGAFRKGKGISEHDDSRTNVAFEDLKGTEDLPPVAHQAEQPAEPIVMWERFLPVRALKVLLVENDDSTRQVVGALLRNCSYEVVVAANGLQAWRFLEDLSNHIDLVLTEVFLSDLCGVTLLNKIMNHKTCKNIPVIMMSSNDSMSTVFKCLSKGAVDFLAKPIRKNELKNLWQHVWRRLQSSSGSGSGSGSESGIQTQKSAKSRCPVDCNNNSGSNDEDNGCNDLNARDSSENDSETQISYTKQATEVECLQHMSPSDQMADSPDSTCAQVIHPKSGVLSSNGGYQGQKELTDEIMSKDLKIGVPINAEMQYETHPRKVMNFSKQRDMNEDKLLDSDQNKEIPTLESNDVSTSDERSAKAFDLIDAMAKNLDTQPLSALQVPKGLSKIPECQEKTTDNPSDLPNLELSLKRLRSRWECGSSATPDDRNVLRRSEQSAFSRYHKSTASNQAPTGFGGSCSLPDNSSEAMRAESIYNMISSSNPLKQGSNGSSNDSDMGTTTRRNASIYNVTASSNSAPLKPGSAGSSNKNAMESTMNAFAQSEANKKETATTFAFNCIRSTAVPLPKQIRTSTNQQIVHEKTEPSAAGVTRQARGIQRQVQVQHHHHHHHHHLHVHSMSQQKQQQQQQLPDLDDLPPKMASPAPQCWLSNAFAGPVDGNSSKYSVKGSNSAVYHRCKGYNGNSTIANPEMLNILVTDHITETSIPGGGNASSSGSGSGVVQIRIAQREAALKKFREKRTERNFIKKVRYQSRKILAEQRPRVRGQFVRKTVREENNEVKER